MHCRVSAVTIKISEYQIIRFGLVTSFRSELYSSTVALVKISMKLEALKVQRMG